MNVDLLRKLAVLAASAVFASNHDAFADVIVGLPASTTEGNCIPFGCAIGFSRFQEVYDASSFPTPIEIDALDFFEAPFIPSQTLGGGDFVLRLSTTSKPVGGLDTANMNNNVGADLALFASVTLPSGTAPAVLSFTGTPFDYDPALGNLLLDVSFTGIASGGLASFLVPQDAGGLLSRCISTDGRTCGQDTSALITRFVTAAAPVPEPGTLAVVALSVATLYALRRKAGGA